MGEARAPARLSSLVRVSLRGADAVSDLARLEASRAAAPAPRAPRSEAWTWRSFEAGAGAKKCFEAWVEVVNKKVVRGGATGGGDATRAAYYALRAHPRRADARAEIEQAFGAVPARDWRDVEAAFDDLAQREAVAASATTTTTTGVSSNGAARRGMSDEVIDDLYDASARSLRDEQKETRTAEAGGAGGGGAPALSGNKEPGLHPPQSTGTGMGRPSTEEEEEEEEEESGFGLPEKFSSSSRSREFDASWLVTQCEALEHSLGTASVALGVVDAVQLGDDVAVQAQLCELLGLSEAAFALMGAVCEEKGAVAAIDKGDVAAICEAMSPGGLSPPPPVPRPKTGVPPPARPSFQQAGSNVSIATASEVAASKKSKKLKFKALREHEAVRRRQDETAALLAAFGADESYLEEQRALGLRSDDAASLSHAAALLTGTEREYQDPSFSLGSNVEYCDGYQEVVVAPPKRLPAPAAGELVEIEELMPAWAARCFAPTRRLNRVQSKVYEGAFLSQKNLLVCAPTGAGKTNIALLTVMELVARHHSENRAEFYAALALHKAVYVAPLKALAQEVVAKFKEKFAQTLGLVIFELTGDTQLSQRDAARAHILVVTPEKWDVVTRKQGGGGGGGAGDQGGSLASRCGLLIVDEIHLLAEERGAVLECVVARTRRLVESSQESIRLVGLSATLPNYKDVAEFLGCSADSCFFFGPEFRPVPLQQTFVGVTETRRLRAAAKLDEICYDKALDAVDRGHQVMVFVHSRRDTAKTAQALLDLAAKHGRDGAFAPGEKKDDASALDGGKLKPFKQALDNCRYAELRTVAEHGFALHHAGMCRADRGLSERLFATGAVKVLVCTATLAWGVNLPAHAVICKGTEIYDPQRGGHVDLSMLDVLQIFGRAGRPQFDDFGEATLLTSAKAMPDYLRKLARSAPIESCLEPRLADALNAEVAAGTVSTIRDGLTWLSHTFMAVRLRKNPLAYRVPMGGGGGDGGEDTAVPARVQRHCETILRNAAKTLDAAHMVRYDRRSGSLAGTEVGRIASHYYLKHESIAEFNDRLQQHATDAQVLLVVCSASEFETLKPRNDETAELDRLRDSPVACPISQRARASSSSSASGGGAPQVRQAVRAAQQPAQQHRTKASSHNEFTSELDAVADEAAGKAAVLLQAHISRAPIGTFTLASDASYVAKNAARVCRALFEMALRAHWPSLAERLLNLAKSVERRVWWFHSPLRQLADLEPNQNAARRNFPEDALKALEVNKVGIDRILDLGSVDGGFGEIGALCRNQRCGGPFYRAARALPAVELTADLQPITRSVLKCTLVVRAAYDHVPRIHGSGPEPFLIWVEDACAEKIHHVEHLSLKPGQREARLVFTLNVEHPLPPQFYARAHSERWVGCDTLVEIDTRGVRMPTGDDAAQHTDLLPLQPLPVTALRAPYFEQLYPYSHFNPIQTQLFWALYHSNENVLVGAPTGSGKTLLAELCVMRLLNTREAGAAAGGGGGGLDETTTTTATTVAAATPPPPPSSMKLKAVYVAPLKALARERLKDWRVKFGQQVGLKVVELTGDVTPDARSLAEADILITTPEKWDGVTRQWRRRDYARAAALLIIDEIHLLGEDRGPVIEMLITRARFIARETGRPIRVVGLSTALANAQDLGAWMGVRAGKGLFNFRASVRPVTMEAHVAGFAGRHYCPRMATMNKPCYQAIVEHAHGKPALVFVASRRQTRLTALDLIAIAAADTSLHVGVAQGLWLGGGCTADEAQREADLCQDPALRHSLPFGVAVHHAGLVNADRDRVERLFEAGKILVLVCTATLAWGVNFPARLVVIKGTEFYDAKEGKYVDFPITDVLQMMGRAGRPQYDETGVACIFVHAPKKAFYKKFLYEPFPVESHLAEQLHNHLMAEVCTTRAISTRAGAVDFVKGTYYYKRLVQNPSFYHLLLEDEEEENAPAAAAAVRTSLTPRQFQVRVDAHLEDLVEGVLGDLADAGAVSRSEDGAQVRPETLGCIASYYYLDYRTVRDASETMEALDDAIAAAFEKRGRRNSGSRPPSRRSLGLDAEAAAVQVLCDAREFAELPVRHNEDKLNEDLAHRLPMNGCLSADDSLDDPHVKARLLLHARLQGVALPIADYETDTRSVLEQTSRVLAALVDIAADAGLLHATLGLCELSQALGTSTSASRDELCTLPGLGRDPDAVAADLRKRLHLKDGEGLVEATTVLSKKFRAAVKDLALDERLLWRHVDEKLPRSRLSLAVSAADGPQKLRRGDDAALSIAATFKPPAKRATVAAAASSSSSSSSSSKGNKGLGFWLVVADGPNLLALKRLGATGQGRVEATVYAAAPAEGNELQVYAIADSVRGYDAFVTVRLDLDDEADPPDKEEV